MLILILLGGVCGVNAKFGKLILQRDYISSDKFCQHGDQFHEFYPQDECGWLRPPELGQTSDYYMNTCNGSKFVKTFYKSHTCTNTSDAAVQARDLQDCKRDTNWPNYPAKVTCDYDAILVKKPWYTDELCTEATQEVSWDAYPLCMNDIRMDTSEPYVAIGYRWVDGKLKSFRYKKEDCSDENPTSTADSGTEGTTILKCGQYECHAFGNMLGYWYSIECPEDGNTIWPPPNTAVPDDTTAPVSSVVTVSPSGLIFVAVAGWLVS